MTKYVIAKWWEYHGTCGCKVNMHKYKTGIYPYYEIRIGVKVNKFEIRKHGRTIFQGSGQELFEQLYEKEFST